MVHVPVYPQVPLAQTSTGLMAQTTTELMAQTKEVDGPTSRPGGSLRKS